MQTPGTNPTDHLAPGSPPSLHQLQRQRDIAIDAANRLANRLHQAELANAALRADRKDLQAAVARVLVALGMCAAISILWH